MRIEKIIGIIFTVILLTTIGCEQMKVDPNGLTSVSHDDVIPDESPYLGAVVIGGAADNFGTDDYTLNSATIEGDTLLINVSYSGGCERHDFTLIASELFLESLPVQLPVSLAHNANGDNCEAYPTEEYEFDLTPIKNMYQEAYRQQAGTIILRLKDAPNTDLTYEFTM